MDISSELRGYLIEQGADLVGFADLSCINKDNMDKAIAIAIALPPNVVKSMPDGPVKEYFDAYHDIEEKLTNIALQTENYLLERGYRAYAQVASRIKEDINWCTEIPHKTIATNAGLGWIGKSCLLVTEEYGSAIRFASILTNASLDCGEAISESRCGECSQCVNICPAHALYGKLWSKNVGRNEIVDVRVCQQKQIELTHKNTGQDAEYLCGRCIAVCPYSMRYASRKLEV